MFGLSRILIVVNGATGFFMASAFVPVDKVILLSLSEEMENGIGISRKSPLLIIVATAIFRPMRIYRFRSDAHFNDNGC